MAEDMKHTPGPWRYTGEHDNDFIIWGPGESQFLANVGASRVGDVMVAFDVTDQANARLIAAAPELYEALASVNKLISEAAMTGFNWRDGDWPERLFFSQQATSKALHKARGDGPQPIGPPQAVAAQGNRGEG